MGLFGNLLGGGKVDVEGSISVLNRPQETFFVFTVNFFPCAPGAAPLSAGVPAPALLSAGLEVAPVRTPGARLGDVGEHFATRLAPGHYQVCVLALPVALETSPETGRSQLIAEPNNRFGFWPLPGATEVRAGQKRTLSLKLSFPKGLGRFGEPLGASPLLERIGPSNAAAYTRAVQLAGRGDLEGAFQAYAAALRAPALEALLPSDANELRLVLTLGQFKCLLEAGRPEGAETCRRHLVAEVLPRVRLSTADPATAWDVSSTFAIAAARVGNQGIVLEALPAAIAAVLPQLTAGHQGVEGMVREAISSCLRAFVAAQNWASADTVAQAVLEALSPLGRHPLTALPRAYQLEGFLASGGDPRAVSEVAPEGRAVLLRFAQAENLARAAQALAPVQVGPARG